MIASLRAFIEKRKAGSPTNAQIYWIHLKPSRIATLFEQQTGNKVSNGLVKRVLKDLDYKYRKLRKSLATGQYNRRNEQFEIIFELVALMSLDTPIISIDCKKKEQLGLLHRAGKTYCNSPIEVYDHDYSYLSKGKVIPFGIYDMQRNEGFISIGNSHETAAFIKDNLLWWWDHFGIHHYPKAQTILILCDAGGANDYRHYAFKKQMLLLASQIGMDIIICHYPPYASKWNPIEHRLFAHVHHAMSGCVLTDYHFVKELIEHTQTKSGLSVNVRLNLKTYQIGLKHSRNDLDYSRIYFNKKIPKLSYRIAA